jgi:glycosyltransferase-like protein
VAEGAALRVALLTHSVNARGGVVHTLELASALHAAGAQVTVMAPARPGQNLFRAVPCRVHLVDLPRHADGTAAMIRARIEAYVTHLTSRGTSGCVAADFDVLHAEDGIGGNALVTLRERRLIGGFVQTVHHVDRHVDPQIDAWQTRAIQGASEILCVSECWRQALERTYGVAARVVGNGVDLRRFSAQAQPTDADIALRLGLRPKSPLIVSVGGIEARKNTRRILEAFLRVRRRWPNAQFAVVGGASLLDHRRYREDFDAAVRAAGLCVGPGRDVVLTGVLADADMPAVLRVADAVAFASLTEGFGLVVLEALASGTPTVVSRRPPFTEYLREGEVFWADPLDPESIAAALCAASVAQRFSPPPVCARCTWPASAVQHLALYRQFVAGRGSRLH